jgi:hypothetical protein
LRSVIGTGPDATAPAGVGESVDLVDEIGLRSGAEVEVETEVEAEVETETEVSVRLMTCGLAS